MSTEWNKLRLESIFLRFAESQSKLLEINGTGSCVGAAQLLGLSHSPMVQSRPHVVIVPSDDVMDEFATALRFFNPRARLFFIPASDVTPYSGLDANPRIAASRLGGLWNLAHAKAGDVIVIPIQALTQRVMPIEVFNKNSSRYKTNDVLPDQIAKWLSFLGYTTSPRVEDVGQYSLRSGILDIFSPTHRQPIRIELFGESIESLRFFDPETQRTSEPATEFSVAPVREILLDDSVKQTLTQNLLKDWNDRKISEEDYAPVLRDLRSGHYFSQIESLLPFAYAKVSTILDYVKNPTYIWQIDQMEIQRFGDQNLETLLREFKQNTDTIFRPDFDRLFLPLDHLSFPTTAKTISFSRLAMFDDAEGGLAIDRQSYVSQPVQGLSARKNTSDVLFSQAYGKITDWKSSGYLVVISTHTTTQKQRLNSLLEKAEIRCFQPTLQADEVFDPFHLDSHTLAWDSDDVGPWVTLIDRPFPESLTLPEEKLVYLRDDDFFGKKLGQATKAKAETISDRSREFQFTDLKVGDFIVHIEHGVAIYEGLKAMAVAGVQAEFIQLKYKDNDRLYVPIYRIGQIQKYTGIGIVDKLGGNAWQKTKVKVKGHLKDIAAELLKLYAERSQMRRPPFSPTDEMYEEFEAFFPYDETPDQMKAIEDVIDDMTSEKPMDRLVCGDVGFGKTEVALRAAFKAFEDKKQVAILAPTTILVYQHYELFKKRFLHWNARIVNLSRFTSKADITRGIAEAASGEADIIIGTHRLLSKDVVFKNLGLLVIDEEQKFGVAHKERIRRLKLNIDTLTLSATPIPRTLNMSLVGIRDLSTISTAPEDRLPVRTFVTKFDEETIRKAIMGEIQRGGQVFFVHNRVQDINEFAATIREIVPEARIRIGHGQMGEAELEKTMLDFYKHEFDVLLSTTIIESGLDVARANTMIIDRANTFGLSQLYQLRGRVGRSKERAYCYLLLPKKGAIEPLAQERLRLLQEHTALGSGLKIAHHDLELRGGGNILGEAQSGHIDAVGYDLYLELLEDAIRTIKGEAPAHDTIEPEINVRFPALIPDSYMPDIRMRLSYYKTLSDVRSTRDLDRIEDDLRDQFGPPPEPVFNLMGIMLIRRHCKDLGVRDLSSSAKAISLAFTDQTPLDPMAVIKLATQQPKQFSITPDNRLIIRMDEITWPKIYDGITTLMRLANLGHLVS